MSIRNKTYLHAVRSSNYVNYGVINQILIFIRKYVWIAYSSVALVEFLGHQSSAVMRSWDSLLMGM